MHNRRVVLFLRLGFGFSVLFLAFIGLSGLTSPNFYVIDKSVLLVTSDVCTGRQPPQATGFAWHQANTIVTALHAVAGCNNITVKLGASDKTWPAQIDRVLIKADLALLTVTGAPPFPPMDVSGEVLTADQPLWVWGFPMGAPKASERPFINLQGGPTLKDLVSTEVAQEIQTSGMPSTGIDVIDVGSLVPGLSGAPVVDVSGKVVGIGDGGLNGGSVGVNWAVPQKYLADLLQSSDDKSLVATMNVTQFSFDRSEVGGQAVTLTCSGRTFTKMSSFDLATAIRGTDSPAGLGQLINIFQMGNPSSTVFDGYQDFSSGATFVLPHNVSSISQGPMCSAQLPASPITFTIEVRNYDPKDVSDAIQKRSLFDADVLLPNPQQWSLDTAGWNTPPVLQPRFDSFAVRRMSWVKLIPVPPQPPVPTERVFSTTAIKRGTFLGVAAHAPASYTQDQGFLFCISNQGAPGCQQILEKLHNWGSAVIAVHLATFPIG